MAQQINSEITGRYFFLSYARLPPLPPVPGVDLADPPNEWIREFYHDLTAAVQKCAGYGSRLRAGFLDVDGTPNPGRRTVLTDALSAAQVFVPLLSPDYFRRSWSCREWESFEQRMRDADVTGPQRITPVVWVPLAAEGQPPRIQEALRAGLSLAHDAAAVPYAENGLRALLRLTPYQGFYQQIVGELATRIVSLAEKAPLVPSLAQDPGQVDSPLSHEARGPIFVVVVATPALASGMVSDWHPFGPDQAAPLPDYARLAAEQCGFSVLAADLEASGDLLRRAPGVILIDPRCATGDETLNAFGAFVAELPSWILPVVIIDAERARQVEKIRTCVVKSYRYQLAAGRSALRGISSLEEFLSLMPFFIAQVEREYLRQGLVERSAFRPSFRPRLSGGSSLPDPSVKENPDV